MKILLSGSHGLIGSALLKSPSGQKQNFIRLVRKKPVQPSSEIFWDPKNRILDPASLEGFDAVIHLAGENIAGRWSAEKKRRVRESRVKGTQFLTEALSKLEKPPSVVLCASAAGFYGDRGEEILTEESPAGTGFLADLCREWEAAADPARKKGIRVIHLRLGIVLSQEGGALGKMLLPFKLGLGGVLGSGRQYISWIALEDVVQAIFHILYHENLKGPVNAVSPQPVTNREFTKTLGKVLGRPTFLSIPAFAAKLVFGEMAEEALLASERVNPKRLVDSGFEFKHPQLEGALRTLLEKKS